MFSPDAQGEGIPRQGRGGGGVYVEVPRVRIQSGSLRIKGLDFLGP